MKRSQPERFGIQKRIRQTEGDNHIAITNESPPTVPGTPTVSRSNSLSSLPAADFKPNTTNDGVVNINPSMNLQGAEKFNVPHNDLWMPD